MKLIVVHIPISPALLSDCILQGASNLDQAVYYLLFSREAEPIVCVCVEREKKKNDREKIIYYKELLHAIMEADKCHDLLVS